MLLDMPSDVLMEILGPLDRRDAFRVMLTGKQGLLKAAPVLYHNVKLETEARLIKFARAMSDPSGTFLASLVVHLSIEIPPAFDKNGQNIVSSKPYAMTNLLAEAVAKMSKLRSFTFAFHGHSVGPKMLDTLVNCPELGRFCVRRAALPNPLGGAVRPYVLPRSLRHLHFEDVPLPNSLLVALLQNSSNLESLKLTALALPRGMAVVEGDYLYGLGDEELPSLREVAIRHLERRGVSLSTVGLVQLLRHANLRQLTLRCNRMSIAADGLGFEIADQQQLKLFQLSCDFAGTDADGMKRFLSMIRSLPPTLSTLEIGDAEQGTAQSPAFDMRKMLASLSANSVMASNLTSLTLGVYGLGTEHYSLIRKICGSLTCFVQLVNSSTDDWRDIFHTFAEAFAGSLTLKEFGLEMLMGAVMTAHTIPWASLGTWKMTLDTAEHTAAIKAILNALPELECLWFNGLVVPAEGCLSHQCVHGNLTMSDVMGKRVIRPDPDSLDPLPVRTEIYRSHVVFPHDNSSPMRVEPRQSSHMPHVEDGEPQVFMQFMSSGPIIPGQLPPSVNISNPVPVDPAFAAVAFPGLMDMMQHPVPPPQT